MQIQDLRKFPESSYQQIYFQVFCKSTKVHVWTFRHLIETQL